VRLIMIRHGRPEWHRPFFISLSRFEHTSAGYDTAHLSSAGVEAIHALAQRLPRAFLLSSDLPRARETAEVLRGGARTIVCSSLFRELQAPRIASGLLGRLWAPTWVWSLVHWCCWILGIGECPEKPRAAWKRTARAADKIFEYFGAEETIILVSHGWFMILLATQLRWRGMIERGPLIPRTGFGAVTEYLLRYE
jgi:broad specificity phosphatase PhoE